MGSFAQARAALAAAVRRVFPDARPSKNWTGVEGWAAPRPAGAVVHASTGTYDPEVVVIGIADRKAGPTIYFLDPGDYFALDTHRDLLEDAGLSVGRGCIYHTRPAALPVAALEELFRRTKARDEAAAKAGGKKAGGARAGAASAAPAEGPQKASARRAAKKPARRPAARKRRR